LGVLNRSLARFDDAEAAYQTAEALARGTGDGHSVLLSRIGRAIALTQRGNFPASEQALLGILADARAARHVDAEARTEHVLGMLHDKRGEPAIAAPHLWRAYELYEDEDAKVRAMGDLGIVLLRVGEVGAAERALREVVRRAAQREVVLNAKVELMHCATYRQDQVGFERYRTELTAHTEAMPPNVLVDFQLKAGIGSARFGNQRRAEQLLERAGAVASAHRLHEFEFRIERIKAELGDCAAPAVEERNTPAESTAQRDALREVSASLALLEA
jgi:tetratricopeptide (TPR) repeat protein